jgi:hypothetical protein
MYVPDLEFEDDKGVFSVTTEDDKVFVTCQRKGSYEGSSYDYGAYWLNESEVGQLIQVLQKWKSNK